MKLKSHIVITGCTSTNLIYRDCDDKTIAETNCIIFIYFNSFSYVSVIRQTVTHTMLEVNSQSPYLSPRPPGLSPRGGRKGSYPAVFGCPTASMSTPTTLDVPNPAALTKRRLSHVSEAVSRRLSTSLTTIGWRSSSNATKDVVKEAKSLCSQYIRYRLRRSGIFNRKLGLQRLRSVINMTVAYGTSDEVFNQLNSVGKELERLYPKLYTSVCRHICFTLTSEDILQDTFTAIATEMFRNEITWAKIVALYAVTGGLAADCVRQGHVKYLSCLIESLGLFVESNLAMWIIQQGGWHTLATYFKPNQPFSIELVISLAIGVGCILIIIFLAWT